MSGRRTGWSLVGPGTRGRSEGAAPGSPGRPARWAVRVAVQVLPAGAVRDRYRDEFVAELYGMPLRRRLRHLAGVAAAMPTLGAVVRKAGRESAEQLDRRPRRRLRCATNVRHRWGTFSTEDGSRFRACVLCGKDYPVRDGRGDDDNRTPGISYGI
ncbi:hypothetical protein [Kineosporia sp. R_H_3]|uniref:hypothetical protein n=1 Tax=Kineosporia sp. R_H_3 TaxID=1961848 RepID=UPI001179C56E|nr:hypothetical protein [Kineosporia sp. R_H_3]